MRRIHTQISHFLPTKKKKSLSRRVWGKLGLCVCVCEREREREGGEVGGEADHVANTNNPAPLTHFITSQITNQNGYNKFRSQLEILEVTKHTKHKNRFMKRQLTVLIVSM
jgi:hypothetical protein